MDYRVTLQQKANTVFLNNFAQNFLHLWRHLPQQCLAGRLFSLLQFPSHMVEIVLHTVQLLLSRNLLVLTHHRCVFLKRLE